MYKVYLLLLCPLFGGSTVHVHVHVHVCFSVTYKFKSDNNKLIIIIIIIIIVIIIIIMFSSAGIILAFFSNQQVFDSVTEFEDTIDDTFDLAEFFINDTVLVS